MPSLKAIFTADAQSFYNTLRGMPSATAQAAQGIRREMNAVFGKSQSTIFNAKEAKDAATQYAEFWEKTLADKSQAAAARAAERRKYHELQVSSYRERLERKSEGAEKHRQEQIAKFKEGLSSGRSGNGLSLDTFQVTSSVESRGIRRMTAGYAQLLHSARATTDSIASGMPLDRVIMQQAPQVVQALTMMKLGWVALGAAVVATTYFGSKWVANMAYQNDALELQGRLLEKRRLSLRQLLQDFRAGRQIEMQGAAEQLELEKQITEEKEKQAQAQMDLAKSDRGTQALDNALIDLKNGKSIDQVEKNLRVNQAREKTKDDQEALKDLERRKHEEEKNLAFMNAGFFSSPELIRLQAEKEKLNNDPRGGFNEEVMASKIDVDRKIEAQKELERQKSKSKLAEFDSKIAAKNNDITTDKINEFRAEEKEKPKITMEHGTVNSLQQIGAFSMPATAQKQVELNQKQVNLLKDIRDAVKGGRSGYDRGFGSARY